MHEGLAHAYEQVSDVHRLSSQDVATSEGQQTAADGAASLHGVLYSSRLEPHRIHILGMTVDHGGVTANGLKDIVEIMRPQRARRGRSFFQRAPSAFDEKVTLPALLAGRSEQTELAAAGRHVLAIQDTSEINFKTTPERRRGLEEIGKGGGRGVLLHALLALDADTDACLGLVAGEAWTRPGRVTVHHNNEYTSKHGAPDLWGLIDRLPRDLWPSLLRGDSGFGNEGVMREAEARRLPYLFKLRLTKNVRRMIEKLASAREWVDAGQGFWAKESPVRLEGWSRARRAIVLRRRLTDAVGLSHDDESGAPQLSFVEIGEATEVYEYSVLVTSLDEAADTFGQLYRDRGDEENIFDEMKNQWGWGGYTTHALAPCRLAARLLALFYNWWNIFVRLADPGLHREAITSRPLFLTAIATRARHARQTTVRVTSSHAKAEPAARALAAVAAFLRGLARNAEQLTRLQKWRAILSRAFQAFLNGRLLRPPPRLAPG